MFDLSKNTVLWLELGKISFEMEITNFSSNRLLGYGEPPTEEDILNAEKYSKLEKRYDEIIELLKDLE